MEQFYSTYQIPSRHREAALIELQEALRIANTQVRLYGQFANVLLIVVTISLSMVFGADTSSKAMNFLSKNPIVVCGSFYVLGLLTLRFFSHLRHQIVINARKVVLLRHALGPNYRSASLILPDNRVEGAVNPFTIKYFPGWLRFEAIPFWAVALGVNLVWLVMAHEIGDRSFTEWWSGHVVITLTYLYIFRAFSKASKDSFRLIVIRSVAPKRMRHRLRHFENILYQAELAYTELDRLGFDYSHFTSIAIEIEDSRFWVSRFGISVRGLLRAALSRFQWLRKKLGYIRSGGTTIPMQLARTLFIPAGTNKFVRKMYELVLAIWLTRKLDKQEIISMYAASVRFDKGVFGISKAVKHFFGQSLRNSQLSPEQAFLLVERLSNSSGTFNPTRVDHLMTRTKVSIDKTTLQALYDSFFRSR